MHVSALRGIEEQDLADGICLEFTEAFNEAKGKSLAKNVTRPSDLRPSMKKLTTPGVPQPSADLLPMSDVRVRSLEELVAAKGRGTNEKSVSVQARPDASSKGNELDLRRGIRDDQQFGESARVKRAERFGSSETVISSSRAKPTPAPTPPIASESLAVAKNKDTGGASSSDPLQARPGASSDEHKINPRSCSAEDRQFGAGAKVKRAERFGCSEAVIASGSSSGKLPLVEPAASSIIISSSSSCSSGSGLLKKTEPASSTDGRLNRRLVDFVVAHLKRCNGFTRNIAQLVPDIYKFDDQAKAYMRAKGGAGHWLQACQELTIDVDGHGCMQNCSLKLTPSSRDGKRSSTEPSGCDGTKRARGAKSVTEDRAGPADSAAPPLSKQEGKRPESAERPAPDDQPELVVMELALPGAIGVSAHTRELIAQRSGCHLERSVLRARGSPFSVRGTALQLRCAAELLLKGAEGAKGGAPELQVAADDKQANWVLGKSGATIKQLQLDHVGVKITIGNPHGDSSRRLVSLRGGAKQIREAVHDIAELWLGQGTARQGTAPQRRAQFSGESVGVSSSFAAGQSSSAGVSAGPPSEVRVRSLGAEAPLSAPHSTIQASELPQPNLPLQPTPSSSALASSVAPSTAAPTVLPPAQPPATAPTSAAAVCLDLTSDEEMVQPSSPMAASHGTRSSTQSPERLDKEDGAKARAERLVKEQTEMQAQHRLEMQRLEEQLRCERQLKEQAPLSDELREELIEALQEAINDKREKAGWTDARIARDPWKNFKVRRELVVCAFTQDDVGRSLSIAGGAVKVNGCERVVLWGGRAPEDVTEAKVLSVEERVGGLLKVHNHGMAAGSTRHRVWWRRCSRTWSR